LLINLIRWSFIVSSTISIVSRSKSAPTSWRVGNMIMVANLHLLQILLLLSSHWLFHTVLVELGIILSLHHGSLSSLYFIFDRTFCTNILTLMPLVEVAASLYASARNTIQMVNWWTIIHSALSILILDLLLIIWTHHHLILHLSLLGTCSLLVVASNHVDFG